MFLHLGQEVMVDEKDIIAICDLDSTTAQSKVSKQFLKTAEEEGFVTTIGEDLPKSFIITETHKKSKIYLSPISSATLLKRSMASLKETAEI